MLKFHFYFIEKRLTQWPNAIETIDSKKNYSETFL